MDTAQVGPNQQSGGAVERIAPVKLEFSAGDVHQEILQCHLAILNVEVRRGARNNQSLWSLLKGFHAEVAGQSPEGIKIAEIDVLQLDRGNSFQCAGELRVGQTTALKSSTRRIISADCPQRLREVRSQ